MNLSKHHVPTHGMCHLCKFDYDSTSHRLLFCPKIRVVWKNSIFWDLLKKHQHDSFWDCALHISNTFAQEDFEYFTAFCWAKWLENCRIKHDSMSRKIEIRVDWVYTFMEHVRNLGRSCELLEPIQQTRLDQPWSPPDINCLRLDVDAGADLQLNKFSAGVVVRNHYGKVVGALACPVGKQYSVTCAELLALRMSMDFCLKLGLRNVSIFSDSLEAVNMVINPHHVLGPTAVLAAEINSMLELHHFSSIHHMRRSANGVAHALARKALFLSNCLEWIDGVIPSWLTIIVSKDL